MIFILVIFLTTSLAYEIPLMSPVYLCVTPFLSRISERFKEYPSILHFDHQSIYTREMPPNLNSIYLFNYDVQIPSKRPLERRFIHIVDSARVLNDSDFLKIQTKINRLDMVMFVEREVGVQKALLDRFFYARLVFVIKNYPCRTYYCAYRDHKQSCTLTEIDSNDPLPRFKTLHDITKYLNEVSVGYLAGPPHVYVDPITKEPKGSEVDLVKVIAYHLDITYKLASFKYIEKNNSSYYIPILNSVFTFSTITKEPKGTEVEILKAIAYYLNITYKLLSYRDIVQTNSSFYIPMLNSIKTGNISWAIGAINLNEERTIIFDIPKYILVTEYSAIFSRNFGKKDFKKYVRKNLVFLAMAVFCGICVSSVAYLYCKLFKKKQLTTYILLIFLPLYEQTYPFKNVKLTSLRMLFLIWWLSCYVLIISYKIFIYGSMLTEESNLHTLEDLVDNGFKFESFIEEYFYVQKECHEITSPFCQQLLPRFSHHNDTCEALKKMSQTKLAVISETKTLKYMFFKACNVPYEEQSEGGFSTNSVFGVQTLIWPMAKNSILVEPFSKEISLIEQAGLYDLWLRREVGYRNNELHNGNFNKHKILALEDVFFVFGSLIIGYTLAIIAFIGEISKKLIKRIV